MIKNEALKEDRKYISLLIGGSLLISLLAILVGTLFVGSANPLIAGTGAAVQGLGWLWVAGTAGFALFLQARMRQLHGQVKAVRVTK